MIEGLDLVEAGIFLKHRQDLSAGSYESWFKKEIAEIDWSKPVDEVYNLIRASNPAPGAWSTIGGTKVDVFDAARVDRQGAPGEVLSVSTEGVTIAATGGAILVKRVRPAGGQKVSASEFATTADIKPGHVFTSSKPKP